MRKHSSVSNAPLFTLFKKKIQIDASKGGICQSVFANVLCVMVETVQFPLDYVNTDMFIQEHTATIHLITTRLHIFVLSY